MTKLILDLSESDMANALKDCKPGETVTFTNVTGTLATKGEKDAVVDVTDAEYSGGSDQPATPDDETAEGEAPATKPAVAKLAEDY